MLNDDMEADNLNPTYYTIRIREKLAEDWEEWFEGMTMTTDAEGTLLAGYIPDQAALHGIISRVQRLGLHLLAIVEKPEHRESHTNNRQGQ